jgi:hypothetical protein
LIIKKKMPGCVPGIFLAEIYSRRCYNSSIGTQKELEMKKQAVKLVPRTAVVKQFSVGQKVKVTDSEWVKILGASVVEIVGVVTKSNAIGSRWYVKSPNTEKAGMPVSAYLLQPAKIYSRSVL